MFRSRHASQVNWGLYLNWSMIIYVLCIVSYESLSVFFFISQSEMRCIIVAVAKARILSGRNILYVNICECIENTGFVRERMHFSKWINHLWIRTQWFVSFTQMSSIWSTWLLNVRRSTCCKNVKVIIYLGCFVIICGENGALTFFLEWFTLMYFFDTHMYPNKIQNYWSSTCQQL